MDILISHEDVIYYVKLCLRVQPVLPGLIRSGGQPINRDMGSVSAPFTLLSQYLAPQMVTRNEIPWLMSEEQTQFFFSSSSASTNCAKHSHKSSERPRMDAVPVQAPLHIISAALMFQPARVTLG